MVLKLRWRLLSKTMMINQGSHLKKVAPALAIAVALFGLASPSPAADDFVVIVNKANPAESVSAADLRKMFLGEKSTWPSGAKVTAVTPGAETPAYGAAIKRATGMSAADFKRYFIQLSFLGKVVPPPRSLESTAAIAKFVSTYPGAVGCVPSADAGAGVKVLKVE